MTAEEILRKCGLSRESVQKMTSSMNERLSDTRSVSQRNEEKYSMFSDVDRGEDRDINDIYTSLSAGFNNGGATTRKGTYRAFIRNKKAR